MYCRSRATKVLLSIFALAATPAAFATPLTFQITTPGYTTNSDPSLFGTALELSITVDNGGTVSSGQSFDFSDIVSVGVSAIGGAFNETFVRNNPSNAWESEQDGIPFLTTDAQGAATLFLGAQAQEGWFYVLDNSWNELQIGQSSSTVAFYVATNTPPLPSTSKYTEGYAQYFERDTPLTIKQVPEPSSIALMGLGLAGLGFSRRKAK